MTIIVIIVRGTTTNLSSVSSVWSSVLNASYNRSGH